MTAPVKFSNTSRNDHDTVPLHAESGKTGQSSDNKFRLLRGCWLFVMILLLIVIALALVFDRNLCRSKRSHNSIMEDESSRVEGGISDVISETKEAADGFRIVCYYVIQSNNTRSRILPPHSLDPYYCTHIIIGFSAIENGTLQPQNDDYLDVYKKVIALKKVNPSLKVLLSVEDMSSYGEFSRMISTDLHRTTFIKNAISFLNKTGFDGIDLDWEFPSWPDADLNQVKNFSLLIAELRQYVSKQAQHMLLSAAVAAPDLIIQQSYEVGELAKYLDFVSIMSYDYHMFSEFLPLTGPNAPLYPRDQELGYMRTLNADWSANRWLELGLPRKKINVGIPTYGHSFRLTNENNNGWNAPASGFGYTGTDGFTSYPDACKFLKDRKTNHNFDDSYLVPYAYNGNEWISYENELSVKLKAMYVKEKRFGGAMIYSLNSDDFYGECGAKKFVLTRTVNDILTSDDR